VEIARGRLSRSRAVRWSAVLDLSPDLLKISIISMELAVKKKLAMS
jgi:hypothetical protein